MHEQILHDASLPILDLLLDTPYRHTRATLALSRAAKGPYFDPSLTLQTPTAAPKVGIFRFQCRYRDPKS